MSSGARPLVAARSFSLLAVSGVTCTSIWLLYGFRPRPASTQAASRTASICLSQLAIWLQLAGTGDANACGNSISPRNSSSMLPRPANTHVRASRLGVKTIRPSRRLRNIWRACVGSSASTRRSRVGVELVEGPTLGDRIAQGPLPLDEALPIARLRDDN